MSLKFHANQSLKALHCVPTEIKKSGLTLSKPYFKSVLCVTIFPGIREKLTFGSLNPIKAVAVPLTFNRRHLKSGSSSRKRGRVSSQFGALSFRKVYSLDIAWNIIWTKHPMFHFKNIWCDIICCDKQYSVLNSMATCINTSFWYCCNVQSCIFFFTTEW